MDVFLNGFLKKPLVAVSLLVIITMCLTLGEAAPQAGHRRRHNRRKTETMAVGTKEPLALQANNKNRLPYKNYTEHLISRLNNNMRYYNDDLITYKGSTKIVDYDGNHEWLPKINFVNIHNYSQRHQKKRFLYVIKNLYKHVMKYKLIFDLLKNVEIVHKTDEYYEHQKRKLFLNSTCIRISLLLNDVIDIMDLLRIPKTFDVNSMDLSTFHRTVDNTGCEVQDSVAFRGYRNLLDYWKKELRCSQKRKQKLRMCEDYELKLKDREMKKKKRNVLLGSKPKKLSIKRNSG